MLQSIRDRASGIVAYVIIILISIPFALWGINEYFGGGQDLIAAEVNGNEIPMRAFSSEFQQRQRSLRSMFGNRLPSQYSDDAIKDAVIGELVRRELVREEVERSGYRVSDEVLAETIRSIPAFQVDGSFDPGRYDQLLQAQRRSKAEFEAGLRQQIRVGEFEDGIRDTAFLTRSEAADYERLKNQQRDLAYLLFEADKESARSQVTEAQITEYYKANTERFMTPERVQLDFVQISEGEIQSQVGVDEETLQAQYEDQMDRYVSPEERRARHLLIKAEGKGGDAANDAAREKAIEVRNRLAAGEDFKQLAAEFSGDDLTSEIGGDLGFLVRGDMSPEFDKVLFELDRDEISQPVQVDGGFDIIQVTEIKPSEQKSFEQVRDQVEQDYRQREAERRFVEMTERMLTLAYEQPDSLEPVSESLGLPVRKSEWITRDGGEGIGSEPVVREAAFSEEVYGQSRNSDLLELPDGSVLVLRVATREASKVAPLDEVRGEIVDSIAQETAAAQAKERGNAAMLEIRGGADPASVAASSGARFEAPGHIRRTAPKVDSRIRVSAFSLPAPAEGASSVDGVEMSDGAFAVVVLRGIREESAQKGEETAAGADAVVRAYGSRELNAAIGALEEDAKVRIFRENL
ncbi:MAG: SurA N-terminal domain-containing protein [Gammaproteobacteria bacterium]|jgi:peptidyl-prolyl cis-trans isomerase D|nr:SurA N-terminal domain-containing protein [Gammaproteobacteria bacterium]